VDFAKELWGAGRLSRVLLRQREAHSGVSAASEVA